MSAAAPIVTIAWQQPAKWIGVEEHVRRGRIRNRGDLTAGMVVQVMYKKGWYKATVINPDPLRTRNRTKKSCTCCASPTKHIHKHALKGRERRRGSRGNQSSSEPVSEAESTTDSIKDLLEGKTDLKVGTEIDLKADDTPTENPNETSDQKNDSEGDQRNVFDLELAKDESGGVEPEDGTAAEQLDIERKSEIGGESETLTAESESVAVSSTEDENMEVDGEDVKTVEDMKTDVNEQDSDSQLQAEQAIQNINEQMALQESKEVVSNENDQFVQSEIKQTIDNPDSKRQQSIEHQVQTSVEESNANEEPTVEQNVSEQIQCDEGKDQNPQGESDEQQAEIQKDVPVSDKTTEDNTTVVFAASVQIANEHMYSQRVPVVKGTTKETDMTPEPKSESETVTPPVESKCTETKSTESKSTESKSTEIEANLNVKDQSEASSVNSEVGSINSETADSNSATDVNVVYLRPSDINVSIDESEDSQQSSKDQLTQNDHLVQNDQEQIEPEEKEDEIECERFENGKRVEPQQEEPPANSEDQQQPVELEMAHPDEPLGQIKISEPISLAGTVNQDQEKPLELTTDFGQKRSPEKLKLPRHHGSKSGIDKPPEIRHKSKGLVAHQTTLPSGAPGPIILTMKDKKPKHKKSKKNKKHKNKDKDREQEPRPQVPIAPMIPSGPQKPVNQTQRIVGLPHLAPKEAPQRGPQVPARPPQARQPQAPARHPPQSLARQVQSPPSRSIANMMMSNNVVSPPQVMARQVQSPPSRSVAGNMMMPNNVIVSADGTIMQMESNVVISADGPVRQMADPIRHIEPPQAHMQPPQRDMQPQQRGPTPGSRNNSNSSQGSPTSPPNPQQWYQMNMAHHPRMAGHPGHHMAPGDFTNMRARYPHQAYHSGLPPHVEASFAGTPRHMRSPHPMSNVPNSVEAAYIRAQSLARHCYPGHPHHPHWQPNGPPQFMPRDPHMHGGSVLRIPRYGHPHYQRMPGDMAPGSGRPPRPPPLIPAPARQVHPVSIHKIRPEGAPSQQRPAEVHGHSSPNPITPRSSTSESLQSGSPPSGQKRPREPTPAEIENILAHQFQEGNDGERVIGVNELLELRNALRRHHGFSDEPPSKSPRLEGAPGVVQQGMPVPPMLASVGLQQRPPSAPQIAEVAPGGHVIMTQGGVPGNASPRAQYPQNIPAPNRQPHHAPHQQPPTHPGARMISDGVPGNPPNVARHWVAEAQQLYPHASDATASPSAPNSVNPPGQLTKTVPSVEAPNKETPSSASVAPKNQSAGKPAQRSGRKQKNPHRRMTTGADEIVVIKQEPLSPSYEAEECLNSVSNESEEQQPVIIHQIGSDSMDSIASDGRSADGTDRPSGSSGPISQLQTLCTRLSTSRTPIIPSQSQSLQTAPPVSQHLTQAANLPIVHTESVSSSPVVREIRPLPPMMQNEPQHEQRLGLDILAAASSNQETAPAAAQPVSPVEPTSSGLTESAPSPDTSSSAKVDKDADVSRRLSSLEREMGVVKSWLWEIKTILTSRTSNLSKKGLPKCTDTGDGNVMIGAGEHTIVIARSDYLDCWDKTENAKDLVVKLISKVFTEEELAISSFNGGMFKTHYKNRLTDDPRFNAIMIQMEKEYGVASQDDMRAIREAVNNKCRKKAFKFRQQQAITQRISQQYQMYKE